MAVPVTGHGAATARAQATARRVHGAHSEEEGPQYAGLVTRVIAFAVDAALINVAAVLVAAVFALVSSVLPGSSERDEVLVAVGGVAFALWVVGYFLAFWTTTGETPGNRVMRIRVVRADGARLRLRHAVARLLGVVLSAPLLIGFLPILVNERRRGLHDWMAGTVVLSVAPREGPENDRAGSSR